MGKGKVYTKEYYKKMLTNFAFELKTVMPEVTTSLDAETQTVTVQPSVAYAQTVTVQSATTESITEGRIPDRRHIWVET